MQFQFEGFTVKARLYRADVPPWDNRPHYHYHISIRRDGGQAQRFSYWTSTADYREGKKELDVAFAFRCIIEDAILGEMPFEHFTEEFEYADPKEAWKAYQAVKKTTEKIRKIYGGDLHEIINKLSDQGVERKEAGDGDKRNL